MLQAVVNKDSHSPMRRRLCDKPYGRQSQLLLAIDRCLCLPHLHSTPVRRNIAMTFGTEKLKWSGYPMVKEF